MAKSIVKSLINDGISRTIGRALEMPREYEAAEFPRRLAASINDLAKEKELSDGQKYELLYEINRAMLPDFVISERGRVLLEDQEFRAFFQRFSLGNWKNFERRWNLVEFLKTLTNVEGDLAECGVYQGATAFQMCKFAEKHGREVHLFDSYEGLSEPNENDGDFWRARDLTASEDLVRENLRDFSCFKTFKGWIPEAFPQVANRHYAFLHIDVDLEQPTYDSIAFFYPRLSKGGVILLDDHGYDTCPGARKAVLDYMAGKPEVVIDLSSGQGLIIKQ